MTTPTDGSVPLAVSEIEVRAYAIYCARGCADGHDIDDWLEAERQLQAEAEGQTPARSDDGQAAVATTPAHT